MLKKMEHSANFYCKYRLICICSRAYLLKHKIYNAAAVTNQSFKTNTKMVLSAYLYYFLIDDISQVLMLSSKMKK